MGFIRANLLSLFLTILVSAFAIIGMGIQVVSKFNAITNKIRDLREDLNTHANSQGHERLLKEVELLQKDVIALDKRFDIHLQDYTNYKDANLLALNNTDEKIKHTWNKTEKLLEERKTEIKDLQQFLQKQQNFKIRE